MAEDIRQMEMNGQFFCDVLTDTGESGITVYMDNAHHYDMAIQ